jgi:hypothetical protein
MAALKALVVILGVMIVLGTGLLVYMLATGAGTRGGGAVASASIALPKGAAVAGMAGLGDRLALHVTEPGAPDRILILDPARGRIVSTITLEAKE